jgi:hypothetical protein
MPPPPPPPVRAEGMALIPRRGWRSSDSWPRACVHAQDFGPSRAPASPASLPSLLPQLLPCPWSVLQELASFWSLLQALASFACQSALSPTSHT